MLNLMDVSALQCEIARLPDDDLDRLAAFLTTLRRHREAAEMTPGLAKIEVAVALYRDRKVSMGQAARIAEVPRMQFQREIGKRGVTMDYEVEDLHADMETLKSLGFP